MIHQRVTAHRNALRDRKFQKALRKPRPATYQIAIQLAIVIGICTLVYVINHAQHINEHGLPNERETHDFFAEEL